MFRCAWPIRLSMPSTVKALAPCVLAMFAIASGSASGQTPRTFPPSSLRGQLQVVQPPDIALNGRSSRLAPGARIRNTQNLLTNSGEFMGQTLTVNYTVDLLGLVLDVWVLSDAERARLPWPTTPEQAATWLFDPAQQTWTPR
jgi:hypothetical protein